MLSGANGSTFLHTQALVSPKVTSPATCSHSLVQYVLLDFGDVFSNSIHRMTALSPATETLIRLRNNSGKRIS